MTYSSMKIDTIAADDIPNYTAKQYLAEYQRADCVIFDVL